jgi:hypothetical protein
MEEDSEEEEEDPQEEEGLATREPLSIKVGPGVCTSAKEVIRCALALVWMCIKMEMDDLFFIL